MFNKKRQQQLATKITNANNSDMKRGQANVPSSKIIGSLCVSSINMRTGRIMRLDKLFFEMRLKRSTTKVSSFGRIMRLSVQRRATDEKRQQ